MDKQVYDIAVIGSGGGTYIADMAIETGHKVCLVEGTRWGGTCLNRGCIPTKIMVHAADLIRESQRANEIAIDGEPLTINWPKLKERVFQKIDESQSMVDYYAPYQNIELRNAFASFKGKVELNSKSYFHLILESDDYTEEIYAEKVVLANGARTNVPSDIGLENITYMTSESLFNKTTWPETLPQSMTIMGGGDIGVEFAHIFSSFGVKVTLVQRNKRLVPKQDHEVSERILNILERDGIKVMCDTLTLEAYEADGLKHLKIQNRTSKEVEVISSEAVFVSPGVISNADNLHLEAIGLELDDKNWIETNAYLETSIENLYAMGDINGKQQLRHKSNYEGQILAYNLMSPEVKDDTDRRKADYTVVPAATFTAMQIATVGITEEQAIKEEIPHKVGYLPYSSTAQAYARGVLPEDKQYDGFAKVLVHKDTHQILGVHIMADEASSLIELYTHLMAIGKQDKYKADQFENVVQNMTVHPALAEVVTWAFESWREEA